jgi:hypothetical protein
VLLGIKAALGALIGVSLLAVSSRRHFTFAGQAIAQRRTGLGVLLLILAVITIVVLVGLLRLSAGARVGAFVLEGVSVVLALTRIGHRPGLAILSVGISVVVVVLLLGGSSSRAFQRT